jgi:hypothetical protein
MRKKGRNRESAGEKQKKMRVERMREIYVQA